MHADEADAPATLARRLHQAEQAGASDVHLHRTGDSAQVAFRLDGVLTPVTTLPPALAERLFGRIKYLARGTPLSEAVGRRRFPELFVRLVRVGAQGHDLPGLLTLLADYYQRRHSLGTRLQAVLVYPALVLAGAIARSLFFLWFHHPSADPGCRAIAGADVEPGHHAAALAAADLVGRHRSDGAGPGPLAGLALLVALAAG